MRAPRSISPCRMRDTISRPRILRWARSGLRSYLARPKENFVERTLPVTFKIERHILVAKTLEDRGQFARDFEIQRLGQFFGRNFNAHQFTVEARAELAKTQSFDFLLADFYRFNVFDGDRRTVRDSRTQTGGGG